MSCHKDSIYIKDAKRKTRVGNSIIKYGWNNFISEIIIENLTIQLANDIETYLIAFFNSTNKNIGLNIRAGGNNSKHSEETRKKISEAKLGTKQSDQTKLKRSASLKGRVSPMRGRKQSLKSIHISSEKAKGNEISLNIKRVNSSSAYYGVSYDKSVNRWSAQLKDKRKYKKIGVYKTEVEAAAAYNKYITTHNLINRFLNVLIDNQP